MARIPNDLIDLIRSEADIVEVLSGFVTLKKAGQNYLGLCPFHDEKTPSFSVNLQRQIFHCFGCGKGGNVFTFLMEHENISFIEAVRHLAHHLNITIPETNKTSEADSEAESLSRVTQFAADFYHQTLLKSDQKEFVRRYTVKRGLAEKVIKRFSLGYAPDGWDRLLKSAAKQGINIEWLTKAGLAKTSGNRSYDTFRKRLMFPIQSPSGRVVGFGGRALSDEEQPKYLNSPESLIYRKSQILYGLYQARDIIREKGQVFIVEGYMDLLALNNHGIENVVAICGTALTRDQARLLARYTKQAFLVYDSDQAGIRATWRAIEPLVESGMWTQIVRLPENTDPDTYVGQYGGPRFLKLVEQADSIAEFMSHQSNVQESGSREEVFRTLTNLIKKTTNLVHRERYREEAERCFPALQSLLASELRQPVMIRRDLRPPQTDQKSLLGGDLVERGLVQLMLIEKPIAEFVENQLELEDFKNPLYKKIAGYIFGQLTGSTYDPSSLIDTINDEGIKRVISELINIADSGINLKERAHDHITRIKHKCLKESMSNLIAEIKQMEKEGRTNELNEAMATYMELKEQEKNLLQ
tara:strand:- start:166371 stop:168122 length:1752 start_codon:yes stop_codon:yes gene_type:complete